MPTIRFFGTIKDGERKYYRPTDHANHLRSMEGKEFQETIELRHYETTPDEHGYYRAGVIRTAMQSEAFGGWTENEIHEYFAKKYLSYTYHKVIVGPKENKTIEVGGVRSTASIGKREMALYIQKVIAELATDFDIHILSPEEYFQGKYKTRHEQREQTEEAGQVQSDQDDR